MKDAVEIRWDILGAKLANLTNDEQCDFFKGFAHEMGKYETNYQRELQMFGVRDLLGEKERIMLESCLLCLWYREEDK